MMRIPYGHCRIEPMKFRSPTPDRAEPNYAAANAPGIRCIMFAVEDIEDVVARLLARAELIGDVDAVREQLPAVRSPRP